MCTPSKINMEPKNGDIEDDCPFQLDDFYCSMLIFCVANHPTSDLQRLLVLLNDTLCITWHVNITIFDG